RLQRRSERDRQGWASRRARSPTGDRRSRALHLAVMAAGIGLAPCAGFGQESKHLDWLCACASRAVNSRVYESVAWTTGFARARAAPPAFMRARVIRQTSRAGNGFGRLFSGGGNPPHATRRVGPPDRP